MKISKLFHWLYACLMFLPIFAIGFTCCYAVFNDNAYLSYDGEFDYAIPHYSETSFSVSANNNGAFGFVIQSVNLPQETNIITINFNSDMSIYNSTNANISGYGVLGINFVSINNTNLSGYTSSSKSLVFSTYRFENGGSGVMKTMFCFLDYEINTSVSLPQNLTWIEKDNAFITFERTDDLHIYGSHIGYFFQSHISSAIKDIVYNTIETTSDLSNIFYYSVDKVSQSSLFSWAGNSFLNNPISYITSIFGCPSDSPIITMLSYWLNISIIWLCFDLVMYVPLLCHRWIDKGMKE